MTIILPVSDRYYTKTTFWIIFCFALVFVHPVYAQERHHPEAKGLSLQETILLAIRNNITIRSAYLDRITQKFDLKVAEDIFVPKVTLTPSVQRSSMTTSGVSTLTTNKAIVATVTEALPTGATINLSSSINFSTTEKDRRWDISLTQPLLKGAGIDVATAPLKIARINEQNNVLSLKSTLIDTVTSVIYAYRTYLQAVRQLEISKRSLERAKELVAVNKELIAAGRLAPMELVQTEADVASKEFDLLQNENDADSARLALMKLLDIDKNTRLVPTEKVVIEPVKLDYEGLKAVAIQNRTDYLSALLNLQVAKINLMLAENNKLWDLSLTSSYGEDRLKQTENTINSKNWNVGLKLTIPLRDLTIHQRYLGAKVAVDKAELALNKLRDNIAIEVQDAIRDVEMKLRQVRLAEQLSRLSEQKLAIETEKLKAGRSSNFQLVTFQNDLVSAQNSELNAIISYLNSVTNLEKTLGITLEKWGIKIEQRYEEDYLNLN